MNASRHRPLSLLRASLFALLVLGVMLRPMAMELCEAFTEDHQAPAHAHAHDHEHDHQPAEEAAGDTAGEDWHVHGEQAQADKGGGVADLAPSVVFHPVQYGAAPAPTLLVASVPSVPAIGPFRPPIG